MLYIYVYIYTIYRSIYIPQTWDRLSVYSMSLSQLPNLRFPKPGSLRVGLPMCLGCVRDQRRHSRPLEDAIADESENVGFPVPMVFML